MRVLQVKLLEGGTSAGGISAFLGKAVEPPAAAVVQHAVSSLQLIGALTCAHANSTASALTSQCKLRNAHQRSPELCVSHDVHHSIVRQHSRQRPCTGPHLQPGAIVRR